MTPLVVLIQMPELLESFFLIFKSPTIHTLYNTECFHMPTKYCFARLCFCVS